MADRSATPHPLPTGTVTFLRTDVEGSMRLVRELGSEWDAINTAHLEILRDVVDRHGGVPVRTEGDAMFAVFPEATAAVLAAIDGQRTLTGHQWPDGAEVRVRMGLHSGEAHLAGDDYGGFDVNRSARIAAVGHGGQIVISGPTHGLVASSLPPEIGLHDLGRHALKDVAAQEQLFQVDVPGLRAEFPPLRVASPRLGNLPDRLTSFVGRAEDLEQLRSLIDEHRLVTLTGPGGIGKTSLAIEVARDRAATTPDGAWIVPLESISDPTEMRSAIAQSLGLFDGVERPAVDALPAFLAERSILLVLDTFEHILAAAGDVAALLRASPKSRFVVTSRSALRVGGEQEFPVRPLTHGGSPTGTSDEVAATVSNAAEELFADRARAVLPGWQPDGDSLVVAEICTLLDGLPLGIELAAARLSSLPATAIRDRLATRLPLPGSGPRDGPARQRTLEAAIGWSHDLLTPEEQRAFEALAVFEGGYDTQQAEAVVGAGATGSADPTLESLISLAEHNLISREFVPAGDAAHLMANGIRFAMLKTVQSFALQRANDHDRETDARRRHAAAFRDLAEAAAGHMPSAQQAVWVDRLALDRANLRAALRWSIDSGDAETAQRLLGALWRFWLLDGSLNEGADWVATVLAMPGAGEPGPARVAALAAAGGVAYWRAEPEVAMRRYTQQLEAAEQIGNLAAIADAHANVASAIFIVGGDLADSIRHAEAARRGFQHLDDEVGVTRIDWGFSNLVMMAEGPAAALPKLMDVHERAVRLGDAPYVGLACGTLAWAHFILGDLAAAARWTIESVTTAFALRDVAGTTVSLPVCAILAFELGRPGDAAVILGAFEALRERYGVRPPMSLGQIIATRDPFERAREALDPDSLEAGLARGRQMSLAEVMELVVALDVPDGGLAVT